MVPGRSAIGPSDPGRPSGECAEPFGTIPGERFLLKRPTLPPRSAAGFGAAAAVALIIDRRSVPDVIRTGMCPGWPEVRSAALHPMSPSVPPSRPGHKRPPLKEVLA